MSAELTYNIVQNLGMIIAIIFTMFWAKNYGIGKVKGFFIPAFSQIIGFVFIFLLTWAENGFKNFGEQNAVRFYAFVAVFALLESKIFKVDSRACMDFQAVEVPLVYGLGHFACLARKCCFGFHFVEGSAGYAVAHALTGTDMLPMQVLESVSALLIFAIIVIISIKTKFKANGYMMAYFQILFGATRFLWEFLRDNEKLIVIAPMKNGLSYVSDEAVWGISNLALWGLATFVAGVILLIVMRNANKKKAERETLQAAA